MASCYNIGRYSMASLAVSAPLDFHHLSAQEHHHTWKVIDLHNDQTYYLHRVGATFERFKNLKALNRSREEKSQALLSRKGAHFYTFQKGWFYSSLNPVNKRQFKQFIQNQKNQPSRLKAVVLGLLATLHGTGGYASSPGHTAVEILSSSTHRVSTLQVPLLAAGVLSAALPAAAAAAATTTASEVMTTTATSNVVTTTAAPSLVTTTVAPFFAGLEFPINTYTTDNQYKPSVAALQDGSFVVTWQSYGQDGNGDGVYGQRFDASGAKVGVEFLINTYTKSHQGEPSIATLPDEGFVVTWQSLEQDGNGEGIYGQLFDASGAKLGVEFLVNTYTISSQLNPSVTNLKNGGFVVTWTSRGQDGDLTGIYGQRFDAAGQKTGAEFAVNTYTTSFQDSSNVAALQNGGFVVTWQSFGQDGDEWGVYGQRFDPAGQKTGAEFLINTYTVSHQVRSNVAALQDGGFVVTWDSTGQDGSFTGIYGQRFNASGQKVGPEFPINTYTVSHQRMPSVAALQNGGFVVTWQSSGQDSELSGIYGRIFSLKQVLSTTTIPLTTSATHPMTTEVLYAGVGAAVAALACSLFGILAVCFVRTRKGSRETISEREATQTVLIGNIRATQSLPQTEPNLSLVSAEKSPSTQLDSVLLHSARNSSDYGAAPEQNRGYDSPPTPTAQVTQGYGGPSQRPYDKAPKGGKAAEQNAGAVYNCPPSAKTEMYDAPLLRSGGAANQPYQQMELTENSSYGSSVSPAYGQPPACLDEQEGGATTTQTYNAPPQKDGAAASQPYQQMELTENSSYGSSVSPAYGQPPVCLDEQEGGATTTQTYNAPPQKGGAAASQPYQQMELTKNSSYSSSVSPAYGQPPACLDEQEGGATATQTYNAPPQKGGAAATQTYDDAPPQKKS